MQELVQIFKKQGQEFVNDLFSDYLVVTEKLSGSSFSFEIQNNKFTFFKGNGQRPINLVDRTLMVYYEPAIKYIQDTKKSVISTIPDNWSFCFQYFVHNEPGVIKYDKLPKNNLVLTHIQVKGPNGKIAKIIEDPRVIKDWADALNVTPLIPIFKGYLTGEQKIKIREFITLPIEDQEELFGTKSFATYIISILNPNVQETLLQNDLTKPIDSIIFKFYKAGNATVYAAKMIDPFTKNLMKEKEPIDLRRAPADINEIILLDILAFIEERGLRKHDILSSDPDKRYIELISNIFNDYVTKRGDDIKNLNFEKADFVKGDEFDLNVNMIPNQKTRELLHDSPSLQNLYKIMLGSLRKKRNPDKVGSVLTPTVIEDFNKLITNIEEMVNIPNDGSFKTFNDYLDLKKTNESLFNQEPLEDMIIAEKTLSFNEFLSHTKVNLNEALKVPHYDRGKMPVNIFVGRFQPFTLGHVKVFEEMYRENGLPTVVFLVRAAKPDPEKRPFDEDIQQAMFAKLAKEYPHYLQACFVVPNGGIDTLFAAARPAYEPILWGYGSDRKKGYDAMIENPKYREELNVEPNFKGYEIKRGDEDISASKVRHALMIDDKSTFDKMTPKAIHDFYKPLQDILVPIKESEDIEDYVSITEKKGGNSDYSVEATNPGTLISNQHLIDLLDKDNHKMDLYKGFAVNIPNGQITDLFINYINGLNPHDTDELFKQLGSLKDIKDLTPQLLYTTRNVISKLFNLSVRGVGKGELALAWLIPGANIQGGGGAGFDVILHGQKYEVKDLSNSAGGAILAGVKSKVTNFEFWREIVDTLRRLDKLTTNKHNLADYFDPEFVNAANAMLAEQPMILSGEVGKGRFKIIKDFYTQANKVESDTKGYTNIIMRGPNEKPIEMSIIPLHSQDMNGDTITFQIAKKDESLTYILTELKRLKYVRNPDDLEKDMQAAVDKATHDVTYIVFRPNGINIVPPGGFRPAEVSISSLKFIEKDL